MSKPITSISLLVYLTLCVAVRAHPADDVGFDQVLQSMRRETERLQSGIFHVSGTSSQETAVVGKGPDHELQNRNEKSSNVRVLGAFDFEKGLIRNDRTVQIWEPIPLQRRVSPLAPPGEDRRMIFLRTPEASYHYSGAEGITEILDPDVAQSSSFRASGWMDVRALGMYADDEFKGQDFDTMLKNYLDPKFFKEMGSENGVFQIRLVNKFDELLEYWIDSIKGYAMVKSTRRPRTNEKGSPQWGNPDILRTIDWKEISGVRVPIGYQSIVQGYTGVANSILYEKTQYDWRINWESINKPIDDSYFDPQSVQAFGSMISDRRKQKPVVK